VFVEELRRRISEDLTDAIQGEIRVDRTAVALYSSDASLYEIEPVAVAYPRSSSDVEKLAAYSVEQSIPLIARGSGSGLAGGAIGRGIVIDFSRHMNQVLSISGDRVRVQPGVIREQLNRRLRSEGRYFAPDPSNSRITTIGGMLGVDAAGAHAVRIGSTRDHVHSLECVLSGGQRFEAGQESAEIARAVRPGAADGGFLANYDDLPLTTQTAATRRAEIIEQLGSLLHAQEALIRKHQPPLLRNCSGYMLRSILQDGCLNLPRMLVGSEGTLALFTEATLFTMPLPEHRSVALLMFGSLEQAVQATQVILPMDPSACDLLDRRLLSLGRGADIRFRDMILPEAEAGLIVEFTSGSALEVRQRIDDMQRLVRDSGIDFRLTRIAMTFEEVELLWSLPSRVVALLAGLKGDSRPLPFVEDIAVPPDRLAEFLISAQKIFQKHEVTATLYSHAASGQLHFRPILPVPSRSEGSRLEEIARDLYRQVMQVGGTISGEHGDGLSRTSFIRTQYGPLYRVFQQVKEIFDPLKLLNPDKIVSNDPQLTVRHLRETRPVSRLQESTSVPLLPIMQLQWTATEAAEAAVRCNGCGSCRVNEPPERMCPFVEEGNNEEISPRAKATLLRRALCADSPVDLLQSESVRTVIESCFNCKQCQLDCPSEVDIPHIVLETRAQFVRAHGLTRTSWLMSRVHTYARVASRFAFLLNPLLRNALFRRSLEKFIGLAAGRRLPGYAGTPFLESQRVRRIDNTGTPGSPRPTVVYFVDYFANHHDPELAEAFVRVLEHNGFRVFIPRGQTVSGMSMVSVADLVAASDVAEQNLRELAEPAREGYPILCTEPSATLCLTREYPLLLATEDAKIVAQQTQDAGRFLLDLHRRGKLKKDFAPLKLRLAWHTPCHIRAIHREAAMPELLRLIPGVEIVPLEKGCTGMAGTFGAVAEHFQKSLQIGAELIQTMQTVDAVAGVTDCSSCRMQMEQAAAIPTIHPIKLLALSYGLMPRLEQRLKARPAGLSMS
jgi:FAD/FMN-containing dehydrogenase/Fe-S oxidoreductase